MAQGQAGRLTVPIVDLSAQDERICRVINEAARAYQPIMPAGFDPDQYFTQADLEKDLHSINFFGATHGANLVGVIGYQPLQDVALVRHAYVLPGYQRRGFGRLLMGHVESLAVNDGYLRLLVGTYADAAWARAFYRRMGFRPPADSQKLLAEHWNIPCCQAAASVVLEKSLRARA
jgi:GNAT superfamily N-acetyltransferase